MITPMEISFEYNGTTYRYHIDHIFYGESENAVSQLFAAHQYLYTTNRHLGKFVGDICPQCNMTYWKCSECGYTITATSFPETCPSCHKKCDFRNITCYTLECGGPGHIDPRL